MDSEDSDSIVHWFPDLEKHACGYCKQEATSTSYGMWAEMLTVDDYQNLIDRGWRRSGKYCYKAVMNETCCPLYTIRCEAENFRTSKSQKKVVKRMNRFLVQGKSDEKASKFELNLDTSHEVYIKEPENKVDMSQLEEQKKTSNEKGPSNPKKRCIKPKVQKAPEDATETNERKDLSHIKGSQKKAKLIRIERKLEKLRAKGLPAEYVRKEVHIKSLEEHLQVSLDKLKIVLVPTSIPGTEWEKTKKEEYEVYRKYQMIIHGDPPEKCSERGFRRFLLDSPLLPSKPESGPSMGYGSFHQQYWIENRLIAVGVIDILPFCVSSVYFFYDPDYRQLTLGTYGSLQEIQYTRRLRQTCPDLQYYYMGFYIHSCPKMRYKANYKPSYLLCPETYVWFPIETCLPKLAAAKYSRLNENLDALDENHCTPEDLDEIKIILGYQGIIPFKYYKRRFGGQAIVENMGNMLGKINAASLLVVLPSRHTP